MVWSPPGRNRNRHNPVRFIFPGDVESGSDGRFRRWRLSMLKHGGTQGLQHQGPSAPRANNFRITRYSAAGPLRGPQGWIAGIRHFTSKTARGHPV